MEKKEKGNVKFWLITVYYYGINMDIKEFWYNGASETNKRLLDDLFRCVCKDESAKEITPFYENLGL